MTKKIPRIDYEMQLIDDVKIFNIRVKISETFFGKYEKKKEPSFSAKALPHENMNTITQQSNVLLTYLLCNL
jgi:hypothetical protein